tara:strand:+ start:3074 stop:3490 length:417 start_codon:yes stop_codon:yes gene_type:complete
MTDLESKIGGGLTGKNKKKVKTLQGDVNETHVVKSYGSVSSGAIGQPVSLQLYMDEQTPEQLVNNVIAFGRDNGVRVNRNEIRRAIDEVNEDDLRIWGLFRPCPCGSGYGKCVFEHEFQGGGQMSVCLGLRSSVNYTK